MLHFFYFAIDKSPPPKYNYIVKHKKEQTMLKRISKKLKLMKYVKSYLGNDIYRISNRKNEKKCGLLNKNG